MKFLILLILTIIFYPFSLSAENSAYVFLIDEDSKPLIGYKVIQTNKENIFLGKAEILKKWIIITKSELFVAKDSNLYKVKDSIIVDKTKGLVLFIIDFSEKKSLYFNPGEITIDRDIEILIYNKNFIFSKVEKLFPQISEQKISDILSLAAQYETSGEIIKALSLYEEFLKKQPADIKVIDKVATLYYKVGNFPLAKYYLMKLPNNVENITKLAGILIIEKHFEEALKIINNNQSVKNLPYFRYLKGLIYYLIGKKEESYREVIDLLNTSKELSQSLRELLR